ncbi:MAG: hypothetical protein A2015_02135 [Spirochaetes bacterium GWF1_31_7]|nr:MAG: hypothetical protein A2Y30_12000 [Spirochaetes bacterium GWE1_32_154]OHD44690.1 MAG: hypothetical protein A2Y29_05835 [Spirochaetes bacterium GWE2_31_10]OHD47061.1 MAG: hypothetical protein A2015_02135 [Spirochaetes bacterium GWF1_31_7]OHD74903.1 MAG: hypothetical protein A2355_00025 [Spirochaetes bacterium RIFOXYB1_FULL_32_8]HBD94509.1 hypothetical protein [Spirochaetia bacterium]
MNDNKTLPYTNSIIRLLQGAIYSEQEALWDELTTYRYGIADYFAKIGVTLIMSENDGFAYLTDSNDENDEETLDNEKSQSDTDIPSLFSKRQLGYHISLLCVILTKKLLEFEITSGDQTRLILKRQDIKENFGVFLPEKSNEAKTVDLLDTHINKLIEYGFLRKINDSEVEVKRILKAKFSANILTEVNDKLEEYLNAVSE